MRRSLHAGCIWLQRPSETLFSSFMEQVTNLPQKLGGLLKVLTMSRVALAQRLAVDKSLVSRWLSGAVHPSEHNLARLSEMVSEKLPEFRLSDWYTSLEEFASRFGLDVTKSKQAADEAWSKGPLGAFLEAARPELAFRGDAYCGFWRTSRPSVLIRDRIFHDYGMVRRTDDGLLAVHMEGSGLDFRGWLFPVAGNAFVFLFDSTGRTPMNVVFKGTPLPKATTLDGILMMAALDSDRTPAAVPILLERVGDVTDDAEADLARYLEIVECGAAPMQPVPDDVLLSRLNRDCGPAALAVGGDPVLMVGGAASLTRGKAGFDLSG